MKILPALIAVGALVAVPAQAKAPSPKDGSYSGKTSQGLSVKFAVKKSTIASWTPKVQVCRTGPPSDNTTFLNIHIKNGTAHLTDKYSSFTLKFTSRTRATGTLHYRRGDPTDPLQMRLCDSGVVTFTVKHK